MSSDRANMAISERMPNFRPMDFIETRNSGAFSSMFTVPTLMPSRWFSSWPTPVKPPATTWLGIRYIR